MTFNVLHLSLKGVYFEQIKAGTKLEEYRLVTPFWSKRLIDSSGEFKQFNALHLTWGYPPATAIDKHLWLPFRGITRKVITHPHFGDDPVQVFAIDVSGQPYRRQSA